MNFDSNVLQIPVEDIIPNRFQPRRSFDDDGLQELADSIRQHGIIQPLVLRPNGDKYEIVAGERRYKASVMAGLASVPAVIARISDEKSAETSIVENVQRKPLTAIEEAQSYKALLDKGFMSQEDLAKRMGLSQGAISNKLRLLTLSEEVQNAVLENKISERHARSLLKIKDNEEQNKWLNRIITERLTVKQLDDLLKAENTSSVGSEPAIEQPVEEPVKQPEEKPYFADTEVNMTTDEPTEDSTFTLDSIDAFTLKEPQRNIEEPSIIDSVVNNQVTDDIESLDFLPPGMDNGNIEGVISKVDSLINDIQFEKNVSVNKNNDENQTIYTITINKKDQEML